MELNEMNIDQLKAFADEKGIKYNNRIGEDNLRIKVENALKAPDTPDDTSDISEVETTSTDSSETQGAPPEPTVKKPRVKSSKEIFLERKKKANELVRIRVACMNPNKKDWPGEIISVGSAKLGTYKKYVPFNTPWHVPNIILNAIRDRNCSIFYTVKSPRGDKVRKARQIKEFNVEIMEPLSNKEIKDLADQQAISGSIEKD